MGNAGAALATELGYTLSMLIALVMILFTKQKVRLQFRGFHFEGKMLGDVFASGLPSFIMNALGSFMVTFVNIFLVAYSDTAVAFFGAYFKVLTAVVRRRADYGRYLGYLLGQLQLFDVQGGFSVFYATHVEYVVQQTQQVMAGGLKSPGVLPYALRGLRFVA